MIDPWLKNPVNPKAKGNEDPLAGISTLDYILITHGHFDHMGDAVALAKKTGARLISTPELGRNLAKLWGYPKKQMGYDTLMNVGGEIKIADGEVTVAMTPALHTSGIRNPKAQDNEPSDVYGGTPVGFVLIIQNGPTIYHTGDTSYFKDMEVIGETYALDVALINIGGHFVMEPAAAVKATLAVKAKLVIPHHFGTFPVLTQDATGFGEAVKKVGIQFLLMKPGSTVTFEGKTLRRQAIRRSAAAAKSQYSCLLLDLSAPKVRP
jgi:L-ascorbate metabolism protein UlaG (beta-lactamase superfamily)